MLLQDRGCRFRELIAEKMKITQSQYDFDRIAKAIGYIRNHRGEQPDLRTVAEAVAMSPYHFQRMFQEWAGVSPKHFLQFLNVNYAKRIMMETRLLLLDVAGRTGLSSPGRLYDLFVTIEGMTPGEYRNGGEQLHIHYHFAISPFGEILVASTEKGICFMEFADDRDSALVALKSKFPNAKYSFGEDDFQQKTLAIFESDWRDLDEIKLHLKGTEFQFKVWETLLKIPMGGMTTYGDLARVIHEPKACRAVGSAVAKNPVALLIPCHRVIRATGCIGNYHWGSERKAALLGWEAAKMRK